MLRRAGQAAVGNPAHDAPKCRSVVSVHKGNAPATFVDDSRPVPKSVKFSCNFSDATGALVLTR
ncbi:hypothetical protein DSM104635_03647 [Terricaulis silvestris]|uniref:Uncharacterized protein n=1 Tax=Terricaulis silvestris TaxID=2686094 RepID=A0A6I6MMR1_9CAUL|nr:hypothetical protein DSM104635_03647 [Terricaulis silvestris]